MGTNLVTGDYRPYRPVKNLTLAVMLNLMGSNALISGVQFSQISGVRRSAIMKILRKLAKEGIIVRRGVGTSTSQGSGLPIFRDIYEYYGYVRGVHVKLNQILGLFMDLESNILEQAVLRRITLLPIKPCVKR